MICSTANCNKSLRVSESDLEARIQDANPDDAIILAMLIDQRENITSRLDDIERELAQACKLKDTDAMVNLMEEKEDLKWVVFHSPWSSNLQSISTNGLMH